MERRDVIIVGGGPAGAATALHLARRDPERARRAVVLEAAAHPRRKVCAGGLIPHTLDCLEELGIGLATPHVPLTRARVDVPGRRVEVGGARFGAVIRRDEFDASLIAGARAAGVDVREHAKVRALARAGDGWMVTTDAGTFSAPIVIGADGSGSFVRRTVFPEDRAPVARAVMADVPLATAAGWDGHARQRYDFDFRDVPDGLAGYGWAFPCLVDGRPHVNAGVYALRRDARVDLRAMLARLQRELGDDGAARHRAAPIRCWSRARFTAPGLLLVGDAAGVEPLMGEGISFAFEYGRWAAGEIARAFANGDLALAGAEARFRTSWVGRKLHRLGQAAAMFYGPGSRLWLGLAARWPGAQDVGLRWYNGMDGWDRRSGWEALRTALRRLPRTPEAGSPLSWYPTP